MALSVTHTFVSAIPDDVDTSLVRPSNWNDVHAMSGVLPVANGGTGISSFGTGIDTFLGTPTSANLAAALTDETGTGAAVFANGPTFVAPILGTPASGDLSNCTGYPVGSITGTVAGTAGGTGQTTYTKGDILASPGPNTLNKLAVGTDGFVLTADTASTNGIKWAAVSAAAAGAGTEIQYRNAGVLGAMAGTAWDNTNRSLTMTGATVTTSNPVLNMTQTWNAGAVTFTGLLLNITNTASAAASKMLDIQVGGSSRFSVLPSALNSSTVPIITVRGDTTTGFGSSSSGNVLFIAGSTALTLLSGSGVILKSDRYFGFSSGDPSAAGADVFLTRSTAATIQHGNVDASTAIAQTISVQSIVAGTANGTAGADWTFKASSGTGTGTGGNIIFKTPFSAKSSGTGQGTWVDRGIMVSKGKVLTDATPVSLFEIALPAAAQCGGSIYSTVVCTNGTDHQSFSQSISYSAINKAGVYTKSITATTGDKSVSGASTITNTWTLLDGTNKVTVQLSSDTSLTPSSNAFICYYTVWNNSEQAITIL